ncbi:hypothetical protein J3R82DRAFT_11163 [Butyriboletus roseoflavus]|nr:hypothetical protein J3R82DRAFT_11163 [Butyriboletus roseoflavus]
MSLDFDVIFAGGEFIGGTTACVVAGRLAAADPSLKILIVESGQHSRDLPIHVHPCRYIENIALKTTTISFHVGKPSTHLDGRVPVFQSGRAVGGGSAVNFMMYVRGAASDYDNWEALGNKGWGFNQLRSSKRSHPYRIDKPTVTQGPIQISAGGIDLGFGSQFLNVGSAYDPDRPQVDDNNDFKTANAYSVSVLIRSTSGLTSFLSTSHVTRNPNLKIVVGKRVKRVIIENGRAVGIEYTTDGISCQGSDEPVTVKATKLVVVSAGAFGSPSILERSGIGAPSILEKNNIDVLVDLPGVGENYQDHFGVCAAFYASDETETMDDVWSDPEAIAIRVKEWEENGTGKIAQNGIEAIVKVRPTVKQLRSAGPELQSRWERFFQHNPDKPMGIIAASAGFPLDHSMSVGRKILCTIYYILYPEAIGSAHITSGEDANSPLDFDPDIFSKAGDVAQLTLLYKMTRELLRRMPAYRGEVAAFHPKFPPGSPAACRESENPVPIDAPDIVYSDADDEAIAKFHRDTVLATWHSLGTCAMKPRSQGGVVDARLNVYGVEGLKVADMSICPTNVGNNTYSTALLIGEKAAAIIAEDLGVKNT